VHTVTINYKGLAASMDVKTLGESAYGALAHLIYHDSFYHETKRN